MRFSPSLAFAVSAVMLGGAATAVQARERADTPKHVVLVSAKEYEYTAPDTLQSGVNEFHFKNAGTMFHHASIIFLGAHTADEFMAALKANPQGWPSYAMMVGGANAPDPGAESVATVVLQPGNYAMMCFVPDSANVPHFMKGLFHPFVVTGLRSTAKLPAASNSIRLIDYKFEMATAITPGTQTIRVMNNAPQTHELELVELAPGKTVEDLLAWFGKPEGPPPAKAIGGVAPLSPGQNADFTATFEKGTYAFICFMPDMKDGQEHYKHGMTKTFEVKQRQTGRRADRSTGRRAGGQRPPARFSCPPVRPSARQPVSPSARQPVSPSARQPVRPSTSPPTDRA